MWIQELREKKRGSWISGKCGTPALDTILRAAGGGARECEKRGNDATKTRPAGQEKVNEKNYQSKRGKKKLREVQ